MNKTIKLSLACAALFTSLQAGVVDLGEVVVTSATKSEQSIKDVTSNVSVITSQELEEKNYTTVVEALNSIAGISFTSNGGIGKSTSVYLRGFDSKRVLVLIDGIRYNDITGLSGAPFEHLMISDIERIEVVKGAQSGIWGADASAGVINIITKGAKKGLHLNANLEYGSFNTKKYGISGSYKTDNYYIKLSSRVVDTEGFSAQATNGIDVDQFENDGYKNISSNLKFGFNINKTNKIDFSHSYIDAKTESDPSGDPDGKYDSTTKDHFSKINFNHVDNFNKLDIYATRSLFNRDYPDDSWTKEYDGVVYEYGLKSYIPYRDKDFTTLGADYKTFKHENDLEKKYNNKAVYLTNSNNLYSTTVTESLRFDAYDKFDNKTTGKLGVKHNFASVDGLELSANYGTSYNVPTLFNLYSAYGNENIKPENTTSYDLSVKYKTIKLTYFHSIIEDMIDFDTNTFKYANIEGESKISGCEIAYKDEIIKNLLFSATYTYLDTKDENSQTLERRPKNTAKASIDYYPTESLHIGINGEYVGKRVEYVYGTYDIDAQTGKYTLVNLVTNYRVNKNLDFYLKVDNITDKYYQVVDGYATAQRSGYLGIKAKY